jgi:hypothetical protein
MHMGFCQTNELGVFGGGSLFHGDVGSQNSENAILESQPTIGIHLKRNLNYYFGLNLSIMSGRIQAHDVKSNDFYINTRDLQFKSKITEFSFLLEFNFRPYLSRDPDYNYTPFIFSGISKFYYNPQNQASNGIWYNLRPLLTEGQGSDFYPGRELYKLSGIAIPIGVGYKVNIYNYITLSFTLGWRITFNDYIDDVSTTYIAESMLTDLALEMAEPSSHNFNDGFQRGNPYNKDKYGFWGLSIIYSIKDPVKECIDLIQ